MKKIKIIIVMIAVMFVYSIDAAKIAILQGYSQFSQFPKEVAIFWNGGFSGYKRLGARDIFSSPWNKDINAIRWSEWNPQTHKVNHYTFNFHIPTIRAPWLKDPWIIISDNGFIRFDIGQGEQNHKIVSDEFKQKLGQEWAVID